MKSFKQLVKGIIPEGYYDKTAQENEQASSETFAEILKGKDIIALKVKTGVDGKPVITYTRNGMKHFLEPGESFGEWRIVTANDQLLVKGPEDKIVAKIKQYANKSGVNEDWQDEMDQATHTPFADQRKNFADEVYEIYEKGIKEKIDELLSNNGEIGKYLNIKTNKTKIVKQMKEKLLQKTLDSKEIKGGLESVFFDNHKDLYKE